MGRSVGQIEKKWRTLVLSSLIEVGHRFFGEAGQHVDGIVMFDHGVVFDHALHVSGMVKPMEVVESAAGGAVGDFRADGSEAARNLAFIEFFSGLGIGVEEVEMPLTEDGCVVALGLQETGHCGAVGRDQSRSESLNDAFL